MASYKSGGNEDPQFEVETERYRDMELVYPDEIVKEVRVQVKDTTVAQEKLRLYEKAGIGHPPVERLKLVLLNMADRGREIEMEDYKDMSDYTDYFHCSQIRMKEIN